MAQAFNALTPESELSVTSAAAVGLTPVAGENPSHALIHVGTAAIRWTADGTTATTAIGMPVAAGAYIDWTDPDIDYRSMIARFSTIADTATTAVLNIAYFD